VIANRSVAGSEPHFFEKEVVWVCIPQDSEDVALLAGAIVHNLYNRAVKSRRGTYFLVDAPCSRNASPCPARSMP
jgi:hypothetical protein